MFSRAAAVVAHRYLDILNEALSEREIEGNRIEEIWSEKNVYGLPWIESKFCNASDVYYSQIAETKMKTGKIFELTELWIAEKVNSRISKFSSRYIIRL